MGALATTDELVMPGGVAQRSATRHAQGVLYLDREIAAIDNGAGACNVLVASATYGGAPGRRGLTKFVAGVWRSENRICRVVRCGGVSRCLIV